MESEKVKKKTTDKRWLKMFLYDLNDYKTKT